MDFKYVFVAVVIGTALVVGAWILNSKRPTVEVAQPTGALIQASGKCAACHREETSAIVHQYERSAHARKNVTCLDCHQAATEQKSKPHNGFTISVQMTAKNCASCHATQYAQFTRSRHAAPAWAAIAGREAFSDAQYAEAAKYHEAAMNRGPNKLAQLEGKPAIESGCATCHGVGRPNVDGSLGTCTQCHSRHNASVALARQPATCGQCHMGPDHSQIEIYEESKHGVLFELERPIMNLEAPPKELSTRDMPVPTCATCHMSGLEGAKTTHDTTERLSYRLFAAVSTKRPDFERAQQEMKDLCTKCHARSSVEAFYVRAEKIVQSTNEKVLAVEKVVDALHADALLTPEPFDEPIEFEYFDYWHYFGRTAKHGAFMGGADFVQWHGNYELLLRGDEIRHQADALRRDAAVGAKSVPGDERPPGADDAR